MKHMRALWALIIFTGISYPLRVDAFPGSVSVDALTNCTTVSCPGGGWSVGSRYYFEPGTYTITPSGGAANFRNGASDWWVWAINIYVASTGECLGLQCGTLQTTPGPWYPSASDAFAACNGVSVTFTQCTGGNVYFFFGNSFCQDNIGSMTASVVQSPLSQEISLSASPVEVWPSVTSGPNTSTINIRGPAVPLALSVLPVEYSGGHQHDGTRVNHTGTLSTYSCTPDASCQCPPITYTAGEVAGFETIQASSSSSTASATLTISVPGLTPLASSPSYNLTGQTIDHPDNHYGTPGMNSVLPVIAEAYSKTETLGINDMSLIFGGLFDIGPPYGAFWSPPHTLHRVGKSADIDRCAYTGKPKQQCNGYGGYKEVHSGKLRAVAKKSGCDLLDIQLPLLHIECP